MKKLFFLMAVSACIYTCNAQVKEGRTMLGTNFNYGHGNTQQLDTANARPRQTNKNNTFHLGLNYGHMITDHVMLGFGLGYQAVSFNNKTTYANSSTNKQTSTTNDYSAGLFARYYQHIDASKFYAYATGFTNFSLGAGDSKSTYSMGSVSIDYKNTSLSTTFSAGITPGIAFFVNKLIALEASMGSISFANTSNTQRSGKEETQKTTTSTFSSDLNLKFSSLLVGITFYFGR